jgi:hypothetical protein
MRFAIGVLPLSVALFACSAESAAPGDTAPPSPPTSSGTSTTPPATGPAAASSTPAAASSINITPPSENAAVRAGAPAAPLTGAAGAPAAPPAQVPAVANGWCGVKQTLDDKCIACHNEQKVAGAPMSLKTYADTQAVAVSDGSAKVFQLIAKRVHDKTKPMPPQGGLSAEQLAGIDAWVAASALASADPTCPGNVATQPKDGWEWPSNCDATYKLLSHGAGGPDTPQIVPAMQETHPNVTLQAPWGNEEVQMIAWRAVTDNAKVMHHWILYGSSVGRDHLVSSSPGKPHNAPMPSDVGMYLPGGTMTLNMHYNNLQGSKDEPDRSGLEVCVVKGANMRPKVATTYPSFTQFAFTIPAKSVDYNVTGTCNVTATQPVTILSASPHAHKLAHHMKFTVTKASGETVVMHDADFNYEEQGTFELKAPVEINTGDKITTTCVFTNTTNDAVSFGENTADEMCFNFATYYPRGALSCGLLGF